MKRIGIKVPLLVALALASFAGGCASNDGASAEATESNLRDDAAIDRTFGANGEVQLGDEDRSAASVWTVQPDGKILIAGRFNTYVESYVAASSVAAGRGSTPNKLLLWRVTAQGKPDATFGTNGTAVIDVPAFFLPQGIAVTAAGEVLVSGNLTRYDESLPGPEQRFWRTQVLRFSADGAPHPVTPVIELDDSGKYNTGRPVYSTKPQLFPNPRGGFAVAWKKYDAPAAGTADVNLRIQRFSADGTTLGAEVDGGDAVGQTPDGRLFTITKARAVAPAAAGQPWTEIPASVKVLEGEVLFDDVEIGEKCGDIFSVHMEASGDLSYVVPRCGDAMSGQPSTVYILRKDGERAKVSTGMLHVTKNNDPAELTDARLDRSGRLVVTGNSFFYGNRSSSGAFVARFLPDGNVDATFGTAGVVRVAFLDDRNDVRRVAAKVLPVGDHILSLNWNTFRPFVTALRGR